MKTRLGEPDMQVAQRPGCRDGNSDVKSPHPGEGVSSSKQCWGNCRTNCKNAFGFTYHTIHWKRLQMD